MEEDHISANSINEEFIDIINTLSVLDDSFTKETVFLYACLDKINVKLNLKKSTTEDIPLSKRIYSIINKPKGSLELQNILPELTTSMCDSIYEAVSKLNCKYYLFRLEVNISNY